MANSLSAGFIEVWAKEYQTIFYKKNVAKQIADMSFQAQMKKGDTLDRVYRSDLSSSLAAYTRGTDITITDVTDTAETLSVNAQFASGIYRDDFDAIQSNYDFAAAYGKDMATYCSNQVDADVLGEWDTAASTVDDGTLGGTSGNGIVVTTSNILKIFSQAKKKLKRLNIDDSDLYAVISPDVEQVLIEYGAGRDTVMGDGKNENGRITSFYGFDVFVSNQLGTSAQLLIATTPTDGDTVTINGVVFTFKTTLGSTAGNVAIAGSADAARLNLSELINSPGTTDAGQVALSVANQNIIRNCTATDSAANDTLTIDYKGLGVLSVSETLTAAADIWNVNKTGQHLMMGQKGGTTVVMQKEPTIETKEEPKRFGRNILVGELYGYKTFADGAKRNVNVFVDTTGF